MHPVQVSRDVGEVWVVKWDQLCQQQPNLIYCNKNLHLIPNSDFVLKWRKLTCGKHSDSVYHPMAQSPSSSCTLPANRDPQHAPEMSGTYDVQPWSQSSLYLAHEIYPIIVWPLISLMLIAMMHDMVIAYHPYSFPY